MFGLDPLTLSTYVVLAAAPGCPPHAPTQINIVPKTAPVQYDYSLTLKSIQAEQMDTVSPYGYHGHSVTNGYTRSGIAKRFSISFDYSLDKSTGATCLWYKSIDLSLEIAPTVVVAQEVYKYPCIGREVLKHELKHVEVERNVVNEFARSIGQKLFAELKARGFTSGPFHYKRAESVKANMGRVVEQILELEYQKMDIALKERQRAVDSLEEYESVGQYCASFQKNKNALYSDWLK